MADEYTMAQPEKLGGDDGLICVERTVVERVCEHFAIRFTPVYHDMGEGMMVESWTLDQISTGLCVYRGLYGAGATRDACRIVAEMLSTAPVAWSEITNDNLATSTLGHFPRDVFTAAQVGKRITWDEWAGR